MIWSLIGLGSALAVAATAWRRSRSSAGFYDREVYAMDARAHQRYAWASLGFALYFAATYALALPSAGVAGLALYALVALLYGASFLRGSSDE